TPSPDGVTCAQEREGKPLCLRLQSAGLMPDGIRTAGNHVAEVIRARISPEHPIEFATLLSVGDDAQEAPFTLTRTEAGWRVNAPEGATLVSLPEQHRERGSRFQVAGSRVSVSSTLSLEP